MAEGGARGVPIRRIAAVLVGLVVAAALLPLSIAAVTVRAQDTFNRTLASGWGIAEIGGSYTLQGLTTDFKVDSGNGVIALNSPGSNRAAALAGVSLRDTDIAFRVSTDKLALGAPIYVYAAARRIDGLTAYWLKAWFQPDRTHIWAPARRSPAPKRQSA